MDSWGQITQLHVIVKAPGAPFGDLLGDALDAPVPGWKDGRRPALAGIGGLMDHTESITPTPVAGILGLVGFLEQRQNRASAPADYLTASVQPADRTAGCTNAPHHAANIARDTAGFRR